MKYDVLGFCLRLMLMFGWFADAYEIASKAVGSVGNVVDFVKRRLQFVL